MRTLAQQEAQRRLEIAERAAQVGEEQRREREMHALRWEASRLRSENHERREENARLQGLISSEIGREAIQRGFSEIEREVAKKLFERLADKVHVNYYADMAIKILTDGADRRLDVSTLAREIQANLRTEFPLSPETLVKVAQAVLEVLAARRYCVMMPPEMRMALEHLANARRYHVFSPEDKLSRLSDTVQVETVVFWDRRNDEMHYRLQIPRYSMERRREAP